MNLSKISLAVILAFSATLGGCVSNLGGDVYSRDDARQVQTVMLGTIVALRPVQIEGTKTPIGAIAGAGIGGVAGSTMGGGTGSIITTIVGAVGGGLLGAYGESLMTRSNGVEITFNLDSGVTRSVVQQVQANERFSIGDRIRIMNLNGQTRVTRM